MRHIKKQNSKIFPQTGPAKTLSPRGGPWCKVRSKMWYYWDIYT